MDLISILVGAAGGLVVGVWGYRYTIKRNPAKLERWALEIKRRGQQARDRMNG